MYRFFIDEESISGQELVITGEDYKHIRSSLRLRQGDRLEAVNKSIVYLCEIIEITEKSIVSQILSSYQGRNEPSIKISLFQGLAKSNKMETIIQKGTEVGISEFYGFDSSRTVSKIKSHKKEKSKTSRWEAIAESAAKQSKRDIIPVVNSILDFKEMVSLLEGKPTIILYENEKDCNIKDYLSHENHKTLNIVVGPEGGFSKEEISLLEGIGVIVSLGPRILRTETAGVVAASLAIYQWD